MYLITGGSGFVGGAILDRLIADGVSPVVAVRRNSIELPKQCKVVNVRDLDPETDWAKALVNIKFIVHASARVHVMNDKSIEPLKEYRKVNVESTLNFARQASKAGVNRFIFLSSIKVNGEENNNGVPFTANDAPNPSDPYGVSKCEAEMGLREIATQTGMEVVIIRPVLIYGPKVKGNFLSMMRWIKKGIPLPLGAINNKRSFVAIDNLVDLIITCIDHPNAKNQTFLVSDGEDLSMTELLRKLIKAMNKKTLLIPIPMFCLRMGAFLIGKRSLTQRVLGSLQVDIQKTKDLLDWKPIVTVDQALLKTAQAFLKNENQ